MNRDLSDTFGAPAASALRGLLPRRPAVGGQEPATESVERGDATGSVGDPVDETDLDDTDLDDTDLDDTDLDDTDLDDTDSEEFVVRQDADGELDEDEGQNEDESEDQDDPARERSSRAEGRDTSVRNGRRRPVRPAVTPAPRPATSLRATPAASGRPPASGPSPAQGPEPVRRPGTPGRSTKAPAARWRVTRIAARGHIDLLVLLALRQGPGDGRDVVARLLADSDGAIQLPEQTVHRTLHRLTRNRLVVRRRDPAVRRARYLLSETGERVWRSRLGQWQAFVRAVDEIARVGDES